jgi:hypothetical protein
MLAFLLRGQFSYAGYVHIMAFRTRGRPHRLYAFLIANNSHTRAVGYLSALHVGHPTVIRTYNYSLALDLIIPIFKGIRTYELLISSQ